MSHEHEDFGDDAFISSTECHSCKKESRAPSYRIAGDFVACEHCGLDVHMGTTFESWAGEPERAPETRTAASFLQAGLSHMQDRATTYDKQGERSMGKTIAAFNAITGHSLNEEQGWLLMGILKMVRSQQGNFKADNYEDEASYAGLRGECAARNRG